MASSDCTELAFFSHDIGHALDVHAAEVTGSTSPSLLIRDADRGWYGDFDIAEPAPNDYGTVM